MYLEFSISFYKKTHKQSNNLVILVQLPEGLKWVNQSQQPMHYKIICFGIIDHCSNSTSSLYLTHNKNAQNSLLELQYVFNHNIYTYLFLWAFKFTVVRAMGFHLEVSDSIPQSRGLMSSSSDIVYHKIPVGKQL